MWWCFPKQGAEQFDRVVAASVRIEAVCANREHTDPVYAFAEQGAAGLHERATSIREGDMAALEDLARSYEALASNVEQKAAGT